MYETILVTLDTTPTDRAIIDHIKQLAGVMRSKVCLLHVATGVPALWNGEEAGGKEVEEDRAYLETVRSEFASAGIPTTAELAFGDPVKQIVKWIESHPVDLVAMSTHGHHLISDVLLGVTASRVQHQVSVPVLLLRAK